MDRVRTRHRSWRDLYVVAAGFVVLWAVLVTLRHPWAGDFRLHLATVRALADDLWIPKDPLVGSVTGSPYYSPYTVLLGVIASVTGASPRTVLECAGIVNVVLLLVALRRFCRRLGDGPLVAVLAMVFTFLLWGLQPTEWSGFLGLYSLSWTMSYPSVLATAMMLLLWEAFLRHRDGAQGWGTAAAIAALGTLLVLIHPFTAVNTVIGLLAFALARPRAALRVRGLLVLGAAAVVILALVLLWPWSDVFSLFGAAAHFDGVHKSLIMDVVGQFGLAHYGLALMGLPALILAGRRPLGRELQILFGLAVCVIALGAVTGSYGLARSIPVAMLPLHLALASYLGGRASRRSPREAIYPGVVVLACCAGLYGESGGLVRAYWGEVEPATLRAWGTGPVTTGFDSLMTHIRAGDVVIGEDKWPGRLVNARGAYTVVPAWPYPFVDETARGRDAEAFFAASTDPKQRLAIADRYGVTCVLVTAHKAVLGSGALPGFHTEAKTRNGHRVLLCRR